jgi:hypothetical protein
MVIPYWRSRTTYLSHLHGSRNPRRKDLRSAFFCDIQHMVVIIYHHFGKNCRPHLRGQEIQERISWFLKMVLTGCPKISVRITTICYIISQNSADLCWLSYCLPLWKLECVTAFTHSTICSYTKQVNAIHICSPCSVVSLFLYLCLNRIQDDATRLKGPDMFGSKLGSSVHHSAPEHFSCSMLCFVTYCTLLILHCVACTCSCRQKTSWSVAISGGF